MDRERLRRARTAMRAAGLDAVVCRLPEHVRLLSGHWPMIGASFLLFPRMGRPVCVVPHCDGREARAEIWEAKVIEYRHGILTGENGYAVAAAAFAAAARDRNWRRIGYEGSLESIAPGWNAAEPAVPAAPFVALLEKVFGRARLVDATSWLAELRVRKTAWEQERLRVVNEIAAIGLRAFQKAVSPGRTGIDLVTLVEQTIMQQGTGYKGAQRVRAFAQVSTGAAETSWGYRPMVVTTQRKLRAGDLALLELAVVADGFWADRTRVAVAGRPSEAQLRAFETICRAQEAAIRVVRPGVTASEVDQAARAVVHAAGFTDKEFLHVTGHGLGFRYHEPTPLILPGGQTLLEEGMVCTVEPGVYDPQWGGIRIEDNILVTADGAEVLGPAPKRLTA